MAQIITCINAGIYALTRGRQYDLLAHDAEKQQVRVRADLGRCRWFPDYHFDMSGGTVPILEAWRFDDPVVDTLNGRDETNNWVDVRLQFDDGTLRWCQMATPNYLKSLLDNIEPMVYSKHLIVVRDLATATVEQVLRYMNQQGELIDFSLPLDKSEKLE